MNVGAIRITDPAYPAALREHLDDRAPECIFALGKLGILRHRKLALFCSVKCPGNLILKTYDLARELRDEGITVISGFHSPIEKECLRILLRGKQPIIVCPARALDGMRIPAECRAAFRGGRVLFLSPFTESPKRVTKDSARRRNEIVAALADEAFIAQDRKSVV